MSQLETLNVVLNLPQKSSTPSYGWVIFRIDVVICGFCGYQTVFWVPKRNFWTLENHDFQLCATSWLSSLFVVGRGHASYKSWKKSNLDSKQHLNLFSGPTKSLIRLRPRKISNWPEHMPKFVFSRPKMNRWKISSIWKRMKTKNLLKYVISSWGANNFCAFISHLHFSTFISAIQHFNLIYICSFIFTRYSGWMCLVRIFCARNRARNLRRTPYQSQNRHYLH